MVGLAAPPNSAPKNTSLRVTFLFRLLGGLDLDGKGDEPLSSKVGIRSDLITRNPFATATACLARLTVPASTITFWRRSSAITAATLRISLLNCGLAFENLRKVSNKSLTTTVLPATAAVPARPRVQLVSPGRFGNAEKAMTRSFGWDSS